MTLIVILTEHLKQVFKGVVAYKGFSNGSDTFMSLNTELLTGLV